MELQDDKIFFCSKVEECMDPMYALAKRLTRDATDAEDLVAEAITKAWVALGGLDDRSRFRPWILRIVHNCFVSEYRRKSARPVEQAFQDFTADGEEEDLGTLLNRQSDEFLFWWANPEKEVVNRMLGEEIRSAIDSLPEAFRLTIQLVNVEGLGYDEAAEVLGVPPGTVRSRMKRGRTLLQKALWQHARDAGLIEECAAEAR